jgi:hypothetical protein
MAEKGYEARMLHDLKAFINQVKVTKLKDRIETIINAGKSTMSRSWKGLFLHDRSIYQDIQAWKRRVLKQILT